MKQQQSPASSGRGVIISDIKMQFFRVTLNRLISHT